MTLSQHFKAYLIHATLNLAGMVQCIFFAIVPPQWTGHTAETLEALAKDTLASAVKKGLFE